VEKSTQEEAATQIVLHSTYSTQHLHVTRIIVHADESDVIDLCIYYAATLLSGLKELWMRTEHDKYLPIHDIANALGPAQCKLLINIVSGRDTTSSPQYTG